MTHSSHWYFRYLLRIIACSTGREYARRTCDFVPLSLPPPPPFVVSSLVYVVTRIISDSSLRLVETRANSAEAALPRRDPAKLVELSRRRDPRSREFSRISGSIWEISRVSSERNNNNITISLSHRERFTRNSRDSSRTWNVSRCRFDIGKKYLFRFRECTFGCCAREHNA